MLIVYNFWLMLCQIFKFGQIVLFVLVIVCTKLNIQSSRQTLAPSPRLLLIIAGSVKSHLKYLLLNFLRLVGITFERSGQNSFVLSILMYTESEEN